jgi:ferredoxin
VLDWERATALIEEARSLSVQRCYCRQKAEYLGRPCDVPIERCLALNYGADFLVRHGFARRIDRSEAKEILAASRQDNLVQIADNVRDTPTFICNCCPCHCGLIGGLTEFDLPAVNPSAFQAASNLDLCKGCSRCSRACPVGAITMAPLRLYGQRKNKLMPVIDTDRCIGCGVCADQCRQHAMHMERRPARPHVPVNSVERIVRMSLERGRLPHLLFDAGKNRSSRFFNSVLRALCALPPVEKALASNQVRSRFVDYALKNIKAPA